MQPMYVNEKGHADYINFKVPWMSNHMCNEVWDKITYPFPNFNSYIIKLGNGYVISSHTL